MIRFCILKLENRNIYLKQTYIFIFHINVNHTYVLVSDFQISIYIHKPVHFSFELIIWIIISRWMLIQAVTSQTRITISLCHIPTRYNQTGYFEFVYIIFIRIYFVFEKLSTKNTAYGALYFITTI